MQLPKIQIKMGGTSTPPADMVEAARKSLSPSQFGTFVAECPGEITPEKLVKFIEEVRDGTRT